MKHQMHFDCSSRLYHDSCLKKACIRRKYNKLFHVYNTINEFNAWCSIHTNYYFEKGQQNRLLIKELNRKKELLSAGENKSDSDISGAIETGG